MGRRRPDPVLQKVRQLVRKGKRAEAVELLEETLRQNPNHAKARKEYNLHLTNQPFTFEVKEYEELQKIISDFLTSPQALGSMKARALRNLRNRTHYLLQAQAHMLTVIEKKTVQQLRTNINRELQRRRKPAGKVIIILASVVLCLILITGIILFLVKRAESAARTLNQAAEQHCSRAVGLNLLNIHDTGLNRTLDRSVGVAADKLRYHLKATERRIREVDAILYSIEKGEQSVVSQGVHKRAHVGRILKALGADAPPFQLRWNRLLQREKDALQRERISLVEDLMAPLTPPDALTGSPDDDIPILTRRNNLLQQRIDIFQDAEKAFDLPEELIEREVKELAEVKLILKEVVSLRNMLRLLPEAADYETYHQRLASIKTAHYAMSREVQKVCRLLPDLKKIRALMQGHGQKVNPELMQAARTSLLDGGPTFSTAFPATKEQLHLLNELLTNSALKTRLYALTDTAANLHAYSETLPEFRHGKACFLRSALDPERDVFDKKAVEWHNPRAVVQRTLDPRPLHRQLGLHNRTGFHATVNLPKMLTATLQIRGEHIPALARAYVFHYLIRTNDLASEPYLKGLQYAPEMRQTIESFEKLRRECRVRLDGDCWLRRSPEHAAAERRFEKWFNKHHDVDFTKELKRHFGGLMRIAPKFCGYVNEQRKIVLLREYEPGKLFWYLSQNGSMTTSTTGSSLQNPARFSPVFTTEKQF